MNQNCQENSFAPWNDHSENTNPFELLQQQYNSAHQQHASAEKPAQSQVYPKNIIIRKMNKYANVLPKVYEKTHEQIHINRKTQSRLEITLRAINKNELTIRIPDNPLQLPRVQIEHPIKHSLKMLKRNYQAPDMHAEKIDPKSCPILKKDTQIQGKFTEFRGKTRKNSEDLTSNNYVESLKKVNNYEEQIVKRCSLKNLKVYNQEDCEQKIQRLLQKKQGKVGNKVCEKQEKKHILDRILTRLQ